VDIEKGEGAERSDAPDYIPHYTGSFRDLIHPVNVQITPRGILAGGEGKNFSTRKVYMVFCSLLSDFVKMFRGSPHQ